MSGTPESRSVEDIVERYWEHVWIRRDLSVIEELYTDPTVRHTESGTRVVSVRELQQSLSDGLRVVRGESFSIDQLTVADDIAWLRLTLHGVRIATLTPTSFVWLAQYRLSGGKIAEMWALHRSDLDWHSKPDR